MKKPSFKKGQWIIRKWKKENGGEFDFAKFLGEQPADDDNFFTSKFYRFTDKTFYSNFNSKEDVDYFDSRMEFDWRLATEKEIKKYTSIIDNF